MKLGEACGSRGAMNCLRKEVAPSTYKAFVITSNDSAITDHLVSTSSRQYIVN